MTVEDLSIFVLRCHSHIKLYENVSDVNAVIYLTINSPIERCSWLGTQAQETPYTNLAA